MIFRSLLRVSALFCFVGLVWNVHQLITSPTAHWYVARSADATRLAVERALLRTATPKVVSLRLQKALASTPADWQAVNMLMAFAEDEKIPLSAALTNEVQRRRLAELSSSARASACFDCIRNPRSCPVSEAKICDIAIELTPFGDLGSFKLAIDDYRDGRDIDTLDLGLATVGLATSVGVIATGGTSYAAKMGTALIKAGKSAGSLSPRLLNSLKMLSSGLVDVKRLPDNWLLHPQKSRQAIDLSKLNELTATAGALGAMQLKVGPNAALRILQHADSPNEVRTLARATGALEKRAPVAVEVLGGKRVMRLSVELSQLGRRVVGLAAAFIALLASIYWKLISIVVNIIRVTTTRSFKRSDFTRT